MERHHKQLANNIWERIRYINILIIPEPPSYDVLILIAKIFRVTTDYLLGVEHTQNVDLSGLSQEETRALLNLIKAMKHK